MKKSIIPIILILAFLSHGLSQVTDIKYLIEYNDSTSLYDCKIVIVSGEATTVPQRIQFNAQYSVVIPTGSEISIAENYNPLESNQNYTGTVPLNWELGMNAISPHGIPYDYYSITPNLGITSSYNNLYEGDTILLFSLFVEVDPCDNSVRPYDIDLDNYDGLPFGPLDFSNGFTLGSINQIYSGNLMSPFGIINLDEPLEMCFGTTALISTDLNGIWASENPEIASVDENSGIITAVSSGSTNITFVEENSGCVSFLEVKILDAPEANITGDNEICIGEFTTVSPFGDGTWYLSDISIAAFDNSGNILGLSEGTVTLIYSDNENGCISNPLTLTVLAPSDPSCLVNVKDEFSSDFEIYPNPASEFVTIKGEYPIQSVTIYSIEFKKLKEIQTGAYRTESQIHLNNLNPGLYFLMIQSNNNYSFQKLILE